MSKTAEMKVRSFPSDVMLAKNRANEATVEKAKALKIDLKKDAVHNKARYRKAKSIPELLVEIAEKEAAPKEKKKVLS